MSMKYQPKVLQLRSMIRESRLVELSSRDLLGKTTLGRKQKQILNA